jgi:hypothetical protein
MGIDDNVIDPGKSQPVDRMVEQGAPVQFDKRLWHSVGNRAQPGSEPGGQYHRPARRQHHAGSVGSGARRRDAGR